MQRFLPSCNRLKKPPLAAKRFPVSLDFGDGLIQINDDIADLDDDRPTTFTRFQRIADDKKAAGLALTPANRADVPVIRNCHRHWS